MRILIPWPGVKPTPPAVEGQCLNHWTTKEVPKRSFLYLCHTEGYLDHKRHKSKIDLSRIVLICGKCNLKKNRFTEWLRHSNHCSGPRAAAAKSLQSCPTLCYPIDGSPPGSVVPGILQARTLEWVAIPFSNAWKCKVKVKLLSRVRLLMTPWTAAYQAPPSMGFSRQEYWSGVPSPSPNCRHSAY